MHAQFQFLKWIHSKPFSSVSFHFSFKQWKPRLAGSEVVLPQRIALLRLHAHKIPLSVFMGSLRHAVNHSWGHAVNLTLAVLQARQSTELPLVQYQRGAGSIKTRAWAEVSSTTHAIDREKEQGETHTVPKIPTNKWMKSLHKRDSPAPEIQGWINLVHTQ